MAQPAGGSKLLKDEDWMSVWLGFLLIVVVLAGLQLRMPAFKWTTEGEFRGVVAGNTAAVEALVKSAQEKGEADVQSAAAALQTAMGTQDRKAIGDAAKTLGEAAKKAKDAGLKKRAGEVSKGMAGPAGQLAGKVFSGGNIGQSALIGLVLLVVALIGNAIMGRSLGAFIPGFVVVYCLTWLSLVIAGNYTVSYLGLEFVLWALVLGLVISNFFGVPGWLMEAVRTEYYIKIGLVIMGAVTLFSDILKAGGFGMLQALLVIFVVWYACYWLARQFRVDDDFSAMLATAVSICGVSAAIAACGAIKGDRKKLSYVTSLLLVVAVPMMLLMPPIAKALGFPAAVAGGWIGGTIDTTGAVVAAGALHGETALTVATIVKFSQNVLIGVAAFVLAIWWSFKAGAVTGERPGAGVIWERFPKFVLGFLIASFVFSVFVPATTFAAVKGSIMGLRTMWFALAFLSIGLETNFRELVSMEEGRPAAAFVIAQAFNILWTLLLAYLIFGGVLFAAPIG